MAGIEPLLSDLFFTQGLFERRNAASWRAVVRRRSVGFDASVTNASWRALAAGSSWREGLDGAAVVGAPGDDPDPELRNALKHETTINRVISATIRVPHPYVFFGDDGTGGGAA